MAKLLLVEDNELSRDMLSRRLRRRGFELAVAVDGEEALEKAATFRPALILMDLSLPVLDGWQATRQLKADPATAHIPIIALSAHALDEEKGTALAAGCDEYETKPIELRRLLAKIDALMPQEE